MQRWKEIARSLTTSGGVSGSAAPQHALGISGADGDGAQRAPRSDCAGGSARTHEGPGHDLSRIFV